MGKPRLKASEMMVGDETRRRARCWRESLGSLMDAKGMSQRKLADAVNDRFAELGVRTHYAQKNVHEWLMVGYGKPPRNFPRYEVMLQIAHVLGTSVERLVGESEYDSHRAEIAGQYLGLSNNAVKALRRLNTVFDSRLAEYSEAKDWFDERATSLVEGLLTANGLLDLFVRMNNLTMARRRVASGSDAVRRFEGRHDKELMRKAFIIMNDPYLLAGLDVDSIEQYYDDNERAFSEAGISRDELGRLCETVAQFDNAIDEAREEEFTNEMIETAYRYEVQHAFGNLVDEVFPPMRKDSLMEG